MPRAGSTYFLRTSAYSPGTSVPSPRSQPKGDLSFPDCKQLIIPSHFPSLTVNSLSFPATGTSPCFRTDCLGNAWDMHVGHCSQPLAELTSGAHKVNQMARRRAAGLGRSFQLGSEPYGVCVVGLGMPLAKRPHQSTAFIYFKTWIQATMSQLNLSSPYCFSTLANNRVMMLTSTDTGCLF